jgi:hypothetical protein
METLWRPYRQPLHQATKKIAEKEKDWDQTELSKRITKCLPGT